ncbi:MAG TPA: hypothetical protein VKB75_00885, partial [Jatrophihabitans sp.]|nr:hypothetical protein [Jatrophihabitans sp.]
EFDKERDSGVEVVEDNADVVHPKDRHVLERRDPGDWASSPSGAAGRLYREATATITARLASEEGESLSGWSAAWQQVSGSGSTAGRGFPAAAV